MLIVGIDVGGTFTDVVSVDTTSGTVTVDKVPTTYPDPSPGVIEGLRLVTDPARSGPEGAGIGAIVHGTTIGTNALIERRGARTAVVTTDGFRDVLELRLGRKPTVWDFNFDIPPALVPRRLRFGVRERVDAGGHVIQPLDEASLSAVAQTLAAEGVEAVAVCLLFSFLNPEHERAVARALRQALPGAFVTASADVDPHPGEFERLSTTAANAYLGPIVGTYLDRLGTAVTALGLPEPSIMQSNGGQTQIQTVKGTPVLLINSGPSGAVVAARDCAARAGESDVIVGDMGGTSFDLSVITGGRPRALRERLVSGFPVRAAMYDTTSIGAGASSIASVDDGGALVVGPDSARSMPGPACYGRGGSRPTVTDADLCLGHFPVSSIGGGSLVLDRSLAEAAIAEHVAGPLGLSVPEAAAGIVRIVDARMADAIRVEVYGRGLDPRSFTLVVGGAAGPLHAARIARELGIRRILIPPRPGALSAYGAAIADTRHEASTALNMPFDARAAGEIGARLDALRGAVGRVFAAEARSHDAVGYEETLMLRYVSDRTDLPVVVQRSEPGWIAAASKAHSEVHQAVYGFASDTQELVVVGAEVIGTQRSQIASLIGTGQAQRRTAPADPPAAARDGAQHLVYSQDEHAWIPVEVVHRSALGTGDSLSGPTLVQGRDSTTHLLKGQQARILADAAILIEEEAGL
jgi:N-methylhydantoinase A